MPTPGQGRQHACDVPAQLRIAHFHSFSSRCNEQALLNPYGVKISHITISPASLCRQEPLKEGEQNPEEGPEIGQPLSDRRPTLLAFKSSREQVPSSLQPSG